MDTAAITSIGPRPPARQAVRPAWVLSALLALATGGAAAAAADGPPATGPAARAGPAEELAAVGRLPAYYNGRVTTWDAVARAYLAQVSGRDVYFDADGDPQPPARWLLDLTTDPDGPSDLRLIPIDDAKLLTLLGLAAAREPPALQGRYSLKDVSAKWDAFRRESDRVAATPAKDYTAYDRAIGALARRVSALQRLTGTFGSSAVFNAEGAAVEAAVAAERLYVPLWLPPAGPGEGWRTVALALARAKARGRLGNGLERADPTLDALLAMLAAGERRDAITFNRRLADYAALVRDAIAAADVGPPALDFTPLPGWAEAGAPGATDVGPYGDVQAWGRIVATFEIADGDRAATVFINRFAGKIGPAADVVNFWRMSQGLAPIPAADAEAAWKPARVDGRAARRVEITTPAGTHRPVERAVAVLVDDAAAGGGAWEVSLYGPKDLVERLTPAFGTFVRSMRIGPPAAVARQFPEAARRPQQTPAKVTAAVLAADGPRVWCFRLVGTVDAVAAREKEFDAFLASLRPAAHDARPAETRPAETRPAETRPSSPEGLAWSLPDGWSAFPSDGRLAAFVQAGQGDNAAAVLVDVVALDRKQGVDGPLLEGLANVWRAEHDLPSADAGAVARTARHVRAGDRDVVVMDLPGRPPPAAPPAPPAVAPGPETRPAADPAAPRLTYTVPKGWREEKLGAPLRVASFVPAGADGGAVTIIVIALPTTDPAANVNRWRAQLGLAPGSEEETAKAVRDVRIGGVVGHLVDLTGTKDPAQRILVATVERGGRTWYIKMMGPAAAVERQEEAFGAFLESVRFPGD